MSSAQRLAVFRGDRLKTSGGLFRKDLIKNKRGKIVSKKKSGQARDQNNLGKWLRSDNEKVSKAEMLPPPGDASKKRAKPPAKAPAKPKAVAPKPKAVAPKKQAAPKPKPVAPKKKPKAVPKGYNPVTRQPYEKESGLGYVEGGKVNLDNVRTSRRHRKTKRGKSTLESILEAKKRRLERIALLKARQG